MTKGVAPSPRDSHTCTTVENNLFVFGGTDGANPLNDLHILDTCMYLFIVVIVKVQCKVKWLLIYYDYIFYLVQFFGLLSLMNYQFEEFF